MAHQAHPRLILDNVELDRLPLALELAAGRTGVGSRDASDGALIRTGAGGGHVTVVLRDASGAPGGLGAQVQVDLDGDGDFSTRLQAGAVGRAGAVFVGIGAAEAVQVWFVDRGAPGGHVVVRAATAGERLELVDPQSVGHQGVPFLACFVRRAARSALSSRLLVDDAVTADRQEPP